jgi:hypothetical protein
MENSRWSLAFGRWLSAGFANDRRTNDGYFKVAANCLTVLMNVSVARVSVRSRR